MTDRGIGFKGTPDRVHLLALSILKGISAHFSSPVTPGFVIDRPPCLELGRSVWAVLGIRHANK
jgi:hypothetical protein